MKEALLKYLDPIGKDYIGNFIKDFLCISNETIEKNYEIENIVRVPVEKTFNVKSYHKSDKNRTQVVYKKFENCEKTFMQSKGKTTNILQKVLTQFRSFRIEKMNHVNRNRINNYIYRYGIKDTEENFNKIGEVIKERKFYIYCIILYIVDNCRINEEDSTGITIEICTIEHRELLEDLTNSFITKKNKYQKSRKKN